jgi:hypothetical protein
MMGVVFAEKKIERSEKAMVFGAEMMLDGGEGRADTLEGGAGGGIT